MMKKFEIKTCGTCICFMKSSCVYPTSEADSCACSKYQEAYYTLSATPQTTEISKTNMEKEKKLEHKFVSVYKINNDQYVVANSIENAIKLYKDAYEYPYNTVKSVELVNDSAWIEEDENITANTPNCVSSKDYVVKCDYDAKIATALIHATNQGII